METNYPPVLTKENFWNDIQQKYPNAMKIFCDWIDEYKKRVEWDKVFHVPQYECWIGTPPDDGLKKVTGEQIARAPKFHEIPVAMQIGIFFVFATEQPRFSKTPRSKGVDMPGVIDQIAEWFEDAEKRLNGTPS